MIVAISDGILLMGGSGTVSGVSRLATVSSLRMRGPLTQEAGPGCQGRALPGHTGLSVSDQSSEAADTADTAGLTTLQWRCCSDNMTHAQ